MSKQILVVVTSHNQIDASHPTGLWFEEFVAPYEVFQKQGYSITVASPKGGAAPIDPNSMPAEADREQYGESFTALQNTVALNTIDVNTFDAVFLSGGHGTMFDLPSAEVGAVVGKFADAGKIVSAVCHGPAGLVSATYADGTPIVKGQRVTGFTNAEEDAAQLSPLIPFMLQDKLSALGAEFIPSPMWNDHVEVDRNLVTGQNPQSSRSTALAVVDVLEKLQVRVN